MNLHAPQAGAGQTDPETLARVKAALAAKPGAMLETVARENGASLRVALEASDPASRSFAPGEDFDAVWTKLREWGEVLLIVQTPDIVAEVKGALVAGSHSHGYFNIHGDSPIGGHIKAENCAAIAFVDRAFGDRRSCSVQFLNRDGAAMFKIFVTRDAERQLSRDQLARFEALKAEYSA